VVRNIQVEAVGLKSLKKLPREAQRIIFKKLEEYERKPSLLSAHVKRLTDEDPPAWRVRIAEFRGFGYVEGETLHITLFLKKKDV
jgi:mRNA-degrading endonuclease RelE of RelBE toxin-antitoxin system